MGLAGGGVGQRDAAPGGQRLDADADQDHGAVPGGAVIGVPGDHVAVAPRVRRGDPAGGRGRRQQQAHHQGVTGGDARSADRYRDRGLARRGGRRPDPADKSPGRGRLRGGRGLTGLR